jgi:hypothetical protein
MQRNLEKFSVVILQHIPREHNEEANRLAQSASGYRENQEVFANDVCAFGSDLAEDDWRKEIVNCLENPSRKVSRKLRFFIWQPSHLRLQEGACGKQKAWRKKRKYASFLWFRVFPFQLFPLQLFRDHRDGNIEASGIAVTCSFHQAIPGSLQVVVPIRNI